MPGKTQSSREIWQSGRRRRCRATRSKMRQPWNPRDFWLRAYISVYAASRRAAPRYAALRRVASVCIERVCAEYRQGEPGCAMNYDRWAGELAAPLKSRLIYYYVLLLLFGYLYPYNIMPREIPASRRYVTARGSPGIGTSFSASVIT